jgi:hypothetical protein
MCGATAPSLLSLPTTSGERAQCRQPFYMENIFYREHILFGVRAMSPPRPCPSLSAVVGESERAREREREREPPSLPPCLPASLPPSRAPSLFQGHILCTLSKPQVLQAPHAAIECALLLEFVLLGAHPLHTHAATSATGPSQC